MISVKAGGTNSEVTVNQETGASILTEGPDSVAVSGLSAVVKRELEKG